MASAGASEPVLLDPRGPAITAMQCTVGVGLLLGGSGFCVYTTIRTLAEIGDTTSSWAWAGIGVALTAAFVAWVGFGTILDACIERRATLQLAALGVDTTALVLAVAPATPSNDHHERLLLSIRVSGPGFEPFECEQKVLKHRFGGATQGTVLPARVNPATRVFIIERPPERLHPGDA
ncbi:hypothetical protein ABZ565_16555 [Streptomyces sp. NPDC016469]|uniref:hypothetical protein n=1 Tax=Streptomyces sp. NPDC016469 TaxID=3157191 RepID=UPI0033D1DB6D